MAEKRCPFGEPYCGDQCALMKDGNTCLDRLCEVVKGEPKVVNVAAPKPKKD